VAWPGTLTTPSRSLYLNRFMNQIMKAWQHLSDARRKYPDYCHSDRTPPYTTHLPTDKSARPCVPFHTLRIRHVVAFFHCVAFALLARWLPIDTFHVQICVNNNYCNFSKRSLRDKAQTCDNLAIIHKSVTLTDSV